MPVSNSYVRPLLRSFSRTEEEEEEEEKNEGTRSFVGQARILKSDHSMLQKKNRFEKKTEGKKYHRLENVARGMSPIHDGFLKKKKEKFDR